MRVLHILNELRPSGAETMLCTALPHWRRLDIEVEILSTGSSAGPFSSVLRDRGCRVHHLPFAKSVGFLRDAYRLLKAREYDVIHIQTERANFWYALISRLAGRRVIVRTINSTFRFSGLLRLRRCTQRQIMARLFGVEMVAVSKSVKEVEWSYYASRTRVISGWFDDAGYSLPSAADRFDARRALSIDSGATVIASVGNCAPVKNHAAIVEALARLPGDLPLLYLHAGQEDAGHEEQMQAKRLGIDERIRFLGPIVDIRTVLHAADAFLMPSMYEGLGVAAMEAMGSGLPCILSDVQGLRDFATLGEGIIWVEPTSESILAALTKVCAMSTTARQKIGLRLSEAAHRLFCAEQGASAYAELYAELCASCKSRKANAQAQRAY